MKVGKSLSMLFLVSTSACGIGPSHGTSTPSPAVLNGAGEISAPQSDAPAAQADAGMRLLCYQLADYLPGTGGFRTAQETAAPDADAVTRIHGVLYYKDGLELSADSQIVLRGRLAAQAITDGSGIPLLKLAAGSIVTHYANGVLRDVTLAEAFADASRCDSYSAGAAVTFSKYGAVVLVDGVPVSPCGNLDLYDEINGMPTATLRQRPECQR